MKSSIEPGNRVRAATAWLIGGVLTTTSCGGATPGNSDHPVTYPSAQVTGIIVEAMGKAPPKPLEMKLSEAKSTPGTFGGDVALLKAHTEVVVLGEGTDARVAVAPGYQGRVMTSTARGGSGTSYGWINREVVASGERKPHMNVFGGEDRFWLGPEGGQYGLYFPVASPYDFEHWQVPEAIDWGAWEVSERTQTAVGFRKEMRLGNHSGTEFDLRVDRKVALLSAQAIAERLTMPIPPGIAAVGYESQNTVTNTGKKAWSKKKGLLSVWILGMYQPSPKTTIIIPFKSGPESELGPVVNDAYFGKVPAARLKVENGVLFFRGDGQERGKIGIPRKRARPMAASYDAARGVLTLVDYTLPDGSVDYVNSMWENQKAPYGGDVVNSYNDGPPEPGKKPLGPFYEIETSSPALALAPGASATHVHRTLHLEGPRAALDPIVKKLLGVTLADVEAAFSAAR